jgi:hypothetical protein
VSSNGALVPIMLGEALSGWLHGLHLKGMNLVRFIADRDIFARCKDVRAKAVPGFIIVRSTGVIVEYPAGVLCTPWFVDQVPNLFVRAVPKPADAAMAAVLLPQVRVDVSPGVKRGHEFIAVTRRSRWKFLRSREVKFDALERMWQRHGMFLPDVLRPALSICVTRPRNVGALHIPFG